MVSTFRKQIVQTVCLDDVVSRYTTVYRASKSGKTKCCNCQFHPDENSSLQLRIHEQLYECSVCHETGDVVDFVQIMEGCNLFEAILLIAQWYGIIPENPKLTYDVLAEKIRKRHEKDDKTLSVHDSRFLEMITSSLSLEDCKDSLFCPAHTSLEVGLSPEYLPDSYRKLTDCILFPVRDGKNDLKGFIKHRKVDEDERFECQPNSLVEYYLLGLNAGAEEIKRSGFVYFVWSTRELLAMYAAGFTNTVACCSGELTFRQVRALARQVRQVVFIFKDTLSKQIQLTKAANRLKHCGVESFYFPIQGKLPNIFYHIGKNRFEYFIRHNTRMIFLNKTREVMMDVLELKEKELEKERTLKEKVRIRTEMIELRKKLDKLTAILSK
ncbi:MAG: CHC2 zinc finger domain-containing protein [Parabacteroides sp.]|nr:CHC2 zinc finger domain-containing protein [Parabacteroides sp.]